MELPAGVPTPPVRAAMGTYHYGFCELGLPGLQTMPFKHSQRDGPENRGSEDIRNDQRQQGRTDH
jgi:hypothetical protein